MILARGGVINLKGYNILNKISVPCPIIVLFDSGPRIKPR